MYSIDQEKFGFQLTFANPITADEITHCRLESVRSLVAVKPGFGLIIDLRSFRGEEVDKDVREEMQDVIDLYHRAGAYRSCLVLQSNQVTGLYRKRQRDSRTKFYERYLSSENNPMWRQRAIQWVAEGIEPDSQIEKKSSRSRLLMDD